MKLAAVVAMLTLSIACGHATADVQATLKYLSSQPASLLDLGMHRLEMKMINLSRSPYMHFRFGDETVTPNISSSYDAKTRRIRIQIGYDSSEFRAMNDDALQAQLGDRIKVVKMALGIDIENGAPLAGASILLPLFSHQDGAGNFDLGEDLDSSSKKMGADLDEITEIYARVGIRMLCRSELTSLSVTCKRS